MTTLADIYAWAGTTRSIVACRICAAAVTVGVDAHDAGIRADGVELFACEWCCETCREDPKAPSVGQRDILGRRLESFTTVTKDEAGRLIEWMEAHW